MKYLLQNAEYEVQIKSKGAELCSFKQKASQLEYIWQADAAVWGSHAPNLFPIVGELANQQYVYQHKSYHLNRHGFARNTTFNLISESENELELELTDSADSHKVFPFNFSFKVRYQLIRNTLTITYQISNPGKGDLLFSVGAHPGFRVPLLPNERFSDYFLEFDKKITANRHLLNEHGLLNGKTERVLTDNAILPLKKELFQNDALVFKHLDADRVTLKNNRNSHRVTVGFPGFPYLGIWTKSQAGDFICIEPWCGIADTAGISGNLESKEGIIKLASGEEFKRSFCIQID